MRVEHLGYFVEVALCHSITQAAKKLYVSQPAVTAALNALEEDLGFKLMTRSRNGVILTPNGKRVFADACEILKIVEGWSDLRLPNHDEKSEIFLLANTPIYYNILPKLLEELRNDYPNINFYSQETSPEKIIANADSSKIIIALFSRQENKESNLFRYMHKKRWQWRVLAKDYQFVHLSAKNILAKKNTLTLEDISTLNLARKRYPDEGDYSVIFDRYFQEENLFYFNDYHSMIDAIENDKVATLWPHLLGDASESCLNGRIVGKPIEDLPLPTTIFLAAYNTDLLRDEEKSVVDRVEALFIKSISVQERV